MDETQLRSCKVNEKEWQCPVSSCNQVLSRRQTLQSHLLSVHQIQAGNLPKRYKMYETDSTIPMPKRTRNAVIQKERKEETLENISQTEENSSTNGSTVDVDRHGFNQNAETELIQGNVLVIEHEMKLDSIPVFDCTSVIDMDIETDSEHAADEEVEIDSENEELQVDNHDFINTCSSSDEEDEPHSTPKSDGVIDPPLYVIPPSQELFSSDVTKSQHILSVSAFATRHNISDTAIKDLLCLIQLHIPKSNTGETNINEMKDKCGFDKDYLKYHLYCDTCKKLFSSEADECKTPECEGSKAESRKYFVTSHLKKQIQEILERKGMWQSIQDNRDSFSTPRTQIISDVRSSAGYKELQKPGGFLHASSNLTLSLFTDGVPLFKSSGTSIWPVYLLVNEIPAKERFLRKNMLLWGIWQGCGKPKMNMFLRPLVVDLIDLYKNGIQLMIENQIICIKAMLIIATMDLQARAYLTNMTQHNGEFGCLYCLESGTVVPSGKAFCRCYPVREEPVAPRTDKNVRENAKQAGQTGKRTQGFLGESVLSYLPYFSMTSNIVVDYMHGTLLGITKKLLELWFDSKNKDKPHYIGSKVSSIDKLLSQIKPPYLVHRLPRAINNNFHHWKASELRNWLLFYSLPCLQGILPETYLIHFSCLVEATYILLGEGITPVDLDRADSLLKGYVANTELLYGEHCLSLNVHNLTHLVNLVHQWGPLWAYSCFPFESFNGEIKKSVHGTGNVCRQIFWTFQAQKRIAQNAVNVKEGEVKDFITSMLDGPESTCKTHRSADAYQCRVVKLTPVKTLVGEVSQQLHEMVDYGSNAELMEVAKLMRNGYVFYSSNSTKVKKHNSFTIALEGQKGVAVEVNMYIIHMNSRRVFAIGRIMTSQGGILKRRVPHLLQMQYSEKVKVVPAELLQEPLMVINRGESLFVAYLPNHFERD